MSKSSDRARRETATIANCVVLLILFLALTGSGFGQTRRAVLVGIDNYRPATEAEKLRAREQGIASPGRGDYAFGALDGAVSDVESMRDVLLHTFGFSPDNVHVLSNEAATRQAILEAMRKYFIEQAHDGDVLFFFYAGHGSQVRNSASYKADKQDETIVPWDANAGVWDIRDKEIARLFNEALDKHKVVLTAVFDSCHSGSIARGLASPVKVRSIPGDTRDAKDDYHPTPPEDRGALVISAAQFNESASEDSEQHDGKSIPHGAFTLALVRTLNRVPPNSPTRDVFRMTRVALHAAGFAQEPVMAGTEDRFTKGLFGDLSGVSASPKLFVQNITSEGQIVLDGGYSLGLEPKAELKKVEKSRGSEVRVRIVAVNGLSSSVAEPLNKADLASIKKLDAFDVDRWSFPGGAKLSVWLPPSNLPLSEVQKAAVEFGKLKQDLAIKWVDDPTEATPTHIISWTGRTWQLQTPTTTVELSALSAKSVVAHLKADKSSEIRLFLFLPPPVELKNKLPLGPGSENSAIDVATSPSKGKYWLVGRFSGEAVEYSWVRPNTTRAGAESEDLPLLVRSEWLKMGTANDNRISEKLVDHLQGIGRVVGWMTLASPPDDAGFPYALALRDSDTGAWITGSELETAQGADSEKSLRIATPIVKGGQHLEIVLKADLNKLKGFQQPRKVYVFGIDSFGGCMLFFPRGADDQRNLIPTRNADETYDREIPVRKITVAKPWGVDSYIMLTTERPIGDLTVFDCEAVRTRGAGAVRDTQNPLTDLLRRNGSTTRGWDDATPATWSIQRLPVRSIPPGN
jgi:hypothetical protein